MYENTTQACIGQDAQMKQACANKVNAPVQSDSLREKLNAMEKLTMELHNTIERLGEALAPVLPIEDSHPSPAGSMPPSASPLGERVTSFNDSIAYAINKLTKITNEVDL